MKVEAGDRALETARKIAMFSQVAEIPVKDLAALIQSAINAQERELRAKIKPMLDNLHTKPQPETGAWWRGECESNCHACTIERLLAELGGEMSTRSNNSMYFFDGRIFRRQPSYAELHQLLVDTLDNLRLMRQLDSLDKSWQSRVVADGYELFDRWQSINGFAPLGSEFDDDEAGREHTGNE